MKKYKGGNNKLSVVIDGTYYNSTSEAAQKLSISRTTLIRRLKDSKQINYQQQQKIEKCNDRIVGGINLTNTQKTYGRIHLQELESRRMREWIPTGAMKRYEDEINSFVKETFERFKREKEERNK